MGKLVGTFGGVDRSSGSYDCATMGLPLGDGGDISNACIGWITSMVQAPDGSIFLGDYTNRRIRKITTDGIIDTVPGGQHVGSNLALLPDGTLLFTRSYYNNLFMLSPSGVEETFYANYPYFSAGGPSDIAVGADGSIYIGSSSTHKLYRIWPDKTPIVIAGTGTSGFSGDGGPATSAMISSVSGLAVGDDGIIYFTDSSNNRIRKITPDGIITTIAGGGTKASVEEGGLATDLNTIQAPKMQVGPDGSLYLADYSHLVIRKITKAGKMYTVAGLDDKYGNFSGDAIPTDARFYVLQSLLVLQDGSLLVGDMNNKLRLIAPQATSAGEKGALFIPSEDGSEIYGFTPDGLHLSTTNAMTGTTLYTFAYDTKNHLISITDGDGDVTTIERDAGGLPSAIVSPDGQRTQLSLDGDGRLLAVTDPAGETHNMTYGAKGLMASFATPEHHVTTFEYDPSGRLLRENNPANGSWTLANTDIPGGRKISMTSALGRASSYSNVQLVARGPTPSSRYPQWQLERNTHQCQRYNAHHQC